MSKNTTYDYTTKRKGVITHRSYGQAVRKIGTCPVCGERCSIPMYKYLKDNGETSHLADAIHKETLMSLTGFDMMNREKYCKLPADFIDALPLAPFEKQRIERHMTKKIENLKRKRVEIDQQIAELEAKLANGI